MRRRVLSLRLLAVGVVIITSACSSTSGDISTPDSEVDATASTTTAIDSGEAVATTAYRGRAVIEVWPESVEIGTVDFDEVEFLTTPCSDGRPPPTFLINGLGAFTAPTMVHALRVGNPPGLAVPSRIVAQEVEVFDPADDPLAVVRRFSALYIDVDDSPYALRLVLESEDGFFVAVGGGACGYEYPPPAR